MENPDVSKLISDPLGKINSFDATKTPSFPTKLLVKTKSDIPGKFTLPVFTTTSNLIKDFISNLTIVLKTLVLIPNSVKKSTCVSNQAFNVAEISGTLPLKYIVD